MIRVLGPGLIGLVLLGLWLYCIFDVIATEDMLVRNLPKPLWLLIVIFLPTVGSIAWLALGRPANAGWRPGDTDIRPVRRVFGPEDDPSFGGGSSPPTPSRPDEDRLRRWEADVQRREEEMRKKGDNGDGGDKPFPFNW